MEAVALHYFNATGDDELSFAKDDVLNIVNIEDDPNWYTAELNGRSGLVPCNYIELRPHSWYVPHCTREKAEEILLETAPGSKSCVQPDGAFIVRKSQVAPGGFSLSVKNDNQVIHFKVLQDESKKFFLWLYKFDSLNKLVDHHKNISISRTHTILLQDRVTSMKYKEINQPQKQRVIAYFDFVANEADELSFHIGDVIHVLGKEDDNWWLGELNGRQGLFPSNYVKELK